MIQMNREEEARLEDRFKTLTTMLTVQPTGEEPQLKQIDGIRYLIFDFYGTLFISGVGDIGVDAESQNLERFRKALEACHLPADRKIAVLGFGLFGEVVGNHVDRLRKQGSETPEVRIEEVWLEVLNSIRKESGLDREITSELARQFAVEYEARMNPVWPMPGLDISLRTFEEKGVELGIISNSQFYTPIAFRALTGKGLEESGFNPNLLHWSYEEQLKKPSVDFYRRFMTKIHAHDPEASPEMVLYVGNDMLKDIWPADELGMRTALFAGDERSLRWRREDPRCQHLKPDLVITELIQLAECL